MDKFPITNKGFQQIEIELKNHKSIQRPNVIKSIAEAREHGDLSENAEYHAAKEKQSFIEGRIADLESKISRAEVINTKKLKGNKIIYLKNGKFESQYMHSMWRDIREYIIREFLK